MTDLSFVGLAMTRQASERADLGGRLAIVIADLGYNEAAEITGKSVRQLKRYIAGDEPPFGVLASLVEASGVTLDWVTYGSAHSLKDHELSIKWNEIEIKKLQKEISRSTTVEQIEACKELILLNKKRIILDEDIIRIQRQLESENVPVSRNLVGGAFDDIIVRISTEAIINTYRDAGVRLPESALPLEISRFYVELSRKARDVTSETEIRERLPPLIEALRSELLEAAAHPGTGKRSA